VTTLKKRFPRGDFYSAYEAGYCGTTHHEQLCKLGITSIIVHAADIPSTDKQKKNKTDLHDSRSIAENLERNNLRGIYVPTREQKELRSLFRLRETKVKEVTRANNRLKSSLNYYGVAVPEEVTENGFISAKVNDIVRPPLIFITHPLTFRFFKIPLHPIQKNAIICQPTRFMSYWAIRPVITWSIPAKPLTNLLFIFLPVVTWMMCGASRTVMCAL
jgi:hypothetical protein